LTTFVKMLPQKDRMARRGEIKTKAALFANRFYFFGGVAGLVTSLRSYLTHRQTSVREAHSRLMDSSKAVAQNGDDKNKEAWKEAKAAWDKAREEQFSLFVALLKSCVDVMVFSNNPGIDLHLKLRGKKNHEGLHCLCGLISASTVLYDSFPNKGISS